MDDRVTPAFLILVCIMCAHQSGCARLRNDSWCVYARVNHLCQDVWEGSGQTGVTDGSWQTLKFSIRLLIPVFFLLLNIKMKVVFLFIFIFILKLGVWRAPWAQKLYIQPLDVVLQHRDYNIIPENYINFRSVSCWLRPFFLRRCVFKCLFFCWARSLQLRRPHHWPSVAPPISVIF